MINLNAIIRRIIGQRTNSLVIIFSLTIGVACSILIGSFISRELQTDSFHVHKDLIYTLKADDPWSPGQKMFHSRFGSAEFMKENFSEVDDFCRINNATAQKITVNNEDYFDKPLIIAASKNFFEFFSFQLLSNNPKSALEANNHIVISEELEKKYFGTGSAVGQFITLSNRSKEEKMVISGVFRKPFENTQIIFDMVRLIETEQDSRCYLKLTEQADPYDMEKLFTNHKESIPIIHVGNPGSYYLEGLQNTYFDTSRRSVVEASRDKTDLWIAFFIGLMILGVASFNYLGLVNNKVTDKSEEIAVRRINGGRNSNLLFDFMLEHVALLGISFLLAILLTLWAMPFFNELVGTYLTTNYLLQIEPLVLVFGLGIIFSLITFVFVWARLKSFTSTFSSLNKKHSEKILQLPAFNIFQLAVTVSLIISSITIVKQINYISEKPIGLDKEVIEVKIPWEHADKVGVFKEELTKNASIKQVSLTTASPVLEHFLLLLFYEQNGEKKQYAPAGFSGDENYVRTLGIEIIEGQGFSGNPTNDQNKCIINQSLAQMFPDENLIGKSMPGMEEKTVVGIVKDFHYSNLKTMVEPSFISFDDKGRHILVKAGENHAGDAIAAIESTWNHLIPGYPILIESIGDRYEWLHRNNKNYVKLIGGCCLISWILSMVGMFALSFHSSHRRTKEIGIRKVNGAKTLEVISLLNRDFVVWVAIAFVIASPIAYFAMDKWLQNFAYKTELSWWIFALAGLLSLGIALLTVSFQSWKAATRNPVEALRYE